MSDRNHHALLLLTVGLLSPSSFRAEAKGGCANSTSLADLDTSIWPQLWRLTSPDPADPQAENKAEIVDPIGLASAGVKYWNLDPSGYFYPNVSVPWEPADDDEASLDPVLVKFREDNNYDYADIITVTSLVPSFWEEHLHADPTIRYILNGSGYFDLRDTNDQWVRMYVKTGDLMEWPAGIFHRFTVDTNNFITAMRLFQGSPIWTAYPRVSYQLNETAVLARSEYETMYLNCSLEEKEEEEEVTPTEYDSSGVEGDEEAMTESDYSSSGVVSFIGVVGMTTTIMMLLVVGCAIH